MLEELKVVLEMFEFVTNELQGNVVSISRVYPCYIYLHTNLLSDTYTTPESGTSKVLFTENIRKDLFKSLETRFKTLIENDIFKLATFLDPFFGLNAFEEKDQSDIKRKVKTYLAYTKPIENNESSCFKPTQQPRTSNYLTFGKKEPDSVIKFDDIDLSINSYLELIKSGLYENPLLFWKVNEHKYPELASLAKKYLGVQASSAGVERMFNFSGHIITNNRRRTGVSLFCNLVYLKLNESFL